ncbi:D-alanine--poly(phosphoribitol) ligase subunit DltA [Clostridium baratii]|uniref:D-alanine--poly(phosphoribitol) ligase subunit DltA n=1 Tax=Clostridium baratii TaxID=1561 RepID=UPI002A74FE02|nr:D-alanine--poly(phosphoribitol) ligase subunit DltA [Clostridium baratii]MDY3208668.1 D-alanine--poly(phosphoribitol) ligase subunit DltA [Clostridium baratii]
MKIIEGIKNFAKTDRIALKCDGEELSYKDLDNYSESIGAYLKEIHDDLDNTPIIIYGNKDNLIMACMIGALKSGRAYVPLDISFPLDRVLTVTEEVTPKIVINFSDLEKSKFGDVKVINKDELIEIIDKYKDKEVDKASYVKEDENAYILFTSGSTGKPKGVQISSNNIDNFEEWISDYLNIDGSKKVIMNQAAYSFDLSVTTIYPGLTNGCTLFSLSKKTLADYKELFKQLTTSDMAIWVSTPSFAGVCVTEEDFNINMLPKLEAMIFIGEVLPKNLAKELKERFPKTRIINGYGPTEATVGISANDITEEMIEDEKSLPVGVVMETTKIKIVDENGNEVEDGEKGEIIIIGNSVSKGYFKNKEKTNEVFYFEEENGERKRAYKTGDMAYLLEDKIYYCGRRDFQIKLNGFRIEIEDIENNLRKVDNVKNVVVLPIYKDEKISYLQGIVQLEEKNDLSSLKNGMIIKKGLEKFVPSYMIPRNIKIIDEFPTNTNGKIDRKKLMEDMK